MHLRFDRVRARALGQLLRFSVIGVGSTLLYAALAFAFSSGGAPPMAPATGSVLAYAIAAVFSYSGHKYFTFLSAGDRSFERLRFGVVTLLGLMVSFLLPALLSGTLGLPAAVPILMTTILIPLVNFVVLRRWVFATGRTER